MNGSRSASPRVCWGWMVLGSLALAASSASAADHMDGPRTTANHQLDINDVYAFVSPTNSGRVVMIMTVNPLAGMPGRPTTFMEDSPRRAASYEFKVDNDGDAVEEITYKLTFGRPNARGVQNVTLSEERPRRRLSGGGQVGGRGGTRVLARGRTGETIRLPDGGLLRADLFDDPFFFDLDAFHRFEDATIANGLAAGAQEFGKPPLSPKDFFAGFNVSAIVLEIPAQQLRRSARAPLIGIWARTELNGLQFDRMGRPAINTVFNSKVFTGANDGKLKDQFNSEIPSTDRANHRAAFRAAIATLGAADPDALVDLLLPDILTIDTSKRDGFPNGRRLADDVIDVELSLLTNGALKGDGVGNDSAFRTTFPYLAVPNPPMP